MPPVGSRLVRFSALCGMAAPFVFGFTVGILGYLTPGYDPVSQLMSELGGNGAPFAPVMNLLGFAATGILMVLFASGLREGLGKGRAVTAGSLLVAGAGAAFIAMSFISCNRGCVPVTAAGGLHLLLGLLAMAMAIVSAFVFARALRGRAGWEGYWQYSLVTGALLVGTLPVFALAGDTAGLWQRVLVGIVLLWEEIMALRLFVLAGRPGAGGP